MAERDESLKFRVDIVCFAGHLQSITVEGMPREWVDGWAGLLDGTSPLYKFPPCDDPNSAIGKCSLCGMQVQATVVEVL